MGERLYPNVKHITSLFCFAIVLLTAGLFALRLTAFSDAAREAESPAPTPTHEELTVNGAVFTYMLLNEIDYASPEATGNITVMSTEDNIFHMRLEIINDLSGKSIYLSPFLRPGEGIASAQLQGAPLRPGEHNCTAVITVYDPATRRQLHRESRPVTIRISG